MELNEKILRASMDLFFSKGIKAVSMDDVAKSVGISKRTLYEHYESKDALLVACIESILKERNSWMYNMMDGSMSFIEVIIRSIYECLSFAQNINRQFFIDMDKFCYSAVKSSVEQSFEELRKRTESLIEQGKQDGLLRKDVDSKLISHIMVDGDKKVFNNPIIANEWDRTYILKQLSSIFLRGMATEKGAKLMDECMLKLGTAEPAL